MLISFLDGRLIMGLRMNLLAYTFIRALHNVIYIYDYVHVECHIDRYERMRASLL